MNPCIFFFFSLNQFRAAGGRADPSFQTGVNRGQVCDLSLPSINPLHPINNHKTILTLYYTCSYTLNFVYLFSS